MRFTGKEREFYNECYKCPPNYDKLNELLPQININCETDDYCEHDLLSAVVQGYGHTSFCDIDFACFGEVHNCEECQHFKGLSINEGAELLKLVQYFIDNGFDVKKFGGYALHELCWSTYDRYIIDIAKLLLDNGADSRTKRDEEDEDGVLTSIEWKFGDWMTGEYMSANLFSTYYHLIKDERSGLDYHNVYPYEDCLGKKVTKFEVVSFDETDKEFNEQNEEKYKGCIILWFDTIPLIITKYPEVFIDFNMLEKVIHRKATSHLLSNIIGKSFTELYFETDVIAVLCFENEKVKITQSTETDNRFAYITIA